MGRYNTRWLDSAGVVHEWLGMDRQQYQGLCDQIGHVRWQSTWLVEDQGIEKQPPPALLGVPDALPDLTARALRHVKVLETIAARKGVDPYLSLDLPPDRS